MMAAGRGEFLPSFLEGLRRNPEQPVAHTAPARPQPVRKPGPGERLAGSFSKVEAVGKRRKRPPKAAASSGRVESRRCPEPKIKENNADLAKMNTSMSKENFLERLPSEILLKILSYLDASSLSCISHVSKLFHRLADDENLNVSWELTLCGSSGQEITMEQSQVFFFESSVIVVWSGARFPKYHQIRNIQLYGVRKETLKRPEARRPSWRSLMLKLDVKTQRGWFIGRDSLVTLRHLQPCFIIGTWRGEDSVAFIMVTLHFHKLVEKSLLGSPVCPFSETVSLPPVDNSDPEFGLHGYSLHFVLHNTGTEIMSGHFRQLFCHTVQIERGQVQLRVINRTNLTQHRSLSGTIKLPWKCEALEGSVENCCVMSLTLLDEFQKPFWCVSSSIVIMRAKRQLSLDYSGEHFVMRFRNPEGRVTMKLVWLKEQKQFFLISLQVYIPVLKVNKHFSRAY